MSKALAKTDSFAALVPADGDFGLDEIVSINMGEQGVDPSMLDKVKVPGSGGLAWEVPGLDGEPEPMKEITGVIVGVQNIRSYYAKKYDGGNEPPNCSSPDGIYGEADEIAQDKGCGGRCSTCPMSQWDSGENGGQACQQRKLIMHLLPDNMLPVVISLPPTSLREIDKYLLRLTSRKVPFFNAVTSLKLTKAQNKGGVEYSKVSPSFVRLLEGEEKASATSMFKSLSAVFNQVAAAEAADSEEPL